MVIAAGAVVVEFALSLVGSVYGTPSRLIVGPASSFDTSSRGVSALAQLLAGRRHPIRQLNVPVRSASLPLPGTLFVLDPQATLTNELPAIDRYLAAGGSVVLAGRPAVGTLRVLLGRGPLPLWQAATPGPSRAGAPVPQNYAARTVISNTGGSWRTTTTTGVAGPKPGQVRTLVGGTRGALALIADVGRGRLVLLASSSPLDNGLLARGDDAAFALDLAGPAGTAVAFDEYDHLQTSSGSGIAGLPGHWQAGLLLALVAVVVWILSAARRFGPPVRASRELIPPRIAHVDAVAALLASGPPGRVAAGAAPLRKAAREQLCHVLRAPRDATDSELLTRAATTPLPSELVRSIVAEPRSEQDLLALGRAYATLTQRGRWS
ncbi:MAG: DUF4350 domain-containing protein [Acidimicrobiales bacterium]|jgi:hypothetical protein